jgi:hypothetical protein
VTHATRRASAGRFFDRCACGRPAAIAGMGLILIAISEMVASNDGIGFMIWNA